jgi:mono/diheme cytochrome c family protein
VKPAVVVTAVVLASLSACEKVEYEPPDRGARVAEAEILYRTEFFDTIQWASREEQIRDGAVVYLTHCRRCHAPTGEGETEYAAQRGMEVPSLVRPDWPFGTDIDTVRRRIFAGHPAGMPTWGVAGITPREIDAVAGYVLYQLRVEFGE